MVPDGHFLSWSNIPAESRNRLNSDVANEIDFGTNIQEEEKKGRIEQNTLLCNRIVFDRVIVNDFY